MCDVLKLLQNLADTLDRQAGGPGKATLHAAAGKLPDLPLRVPVVLAELNDGTLLPMMVGAVATIDLRPWDEERDVEDKEAARAILSGKARRQSNPIGFVQTGGDTVH